MSRVGHEGFRPEADIDPDTWDHIRQARLSAEKAQALARFAVVLTALVVGSAVAAVVFFA